MTDPSCNDCRNTVRGCPAHREDEQAPRALASEIIRELLERDAPDEETDEDDGTG